MAYVPYDPPLGAPLDHIEAGIIDVDGRLDQVDTSRVAELAARLDEIAEAADTDAEVIRHRFEVNEAALSVLRSQVTPLQAGLDSLQGSFSLALNQLRSDVADALTQVRESISVLQRSDTARQQSILDLQAAVADLQQRAGHHRGYLLVATSTASPRIKAGADYVLAGVGDVAQINNAIRRAAPLKTFSSRQPDGSEQAGMVVISGGRVNVDDAILVRDGVTLAGLGPLTELRAVGLGAKPMIGVATPNEHVFTVRDLWLNGNGADGGTGHLIDLDMTGSTNDGVGTYPSFSPDSDFMLEHLHLSNADNGQRAGIKMGATGTANCRGNMLDRIQIRHCWRGVWMTAASDCHLNMIHVGSCSDAGYLIEAGNTKMVSCKAYYCATGFRFTGGRGAHGVLEAQDCSTGFSYQAGEITAGQLLADSCELAGIELGANSLMISGGNVLFRTGSGTRWSGGAAGIKITGSYTDVVLTGRVGPTNIATKIAGAWGSRWFARVTGGNALDSTG